MQFSVAFQKLGSDDLRHGKCHAKSPSSLVKTLMGHGYHVVEYHEIPESPNDIKRIKTAGEREVC